MSARDQMGPERSEIIDLHGRSVPEETVSMLRQADSWIFFMPLYVDGLPSHIVACLDELSRHEGMQGMSAYVYGVVNLGFAEGEQAATALRILSNWSRRMGFVYGGGLGVGGGGALGHIPIAKGGPAASIHAALGTLVRHARSGTESADVFVSLDFPRFLYKAAAQAGWRQMIRQHGGRPRDLGQRRKPDGTALW